ncbi:MAG: helix-turn-helix domain-containing protein [Patescibacteria group bacterium]
MPRGFTEQERAEIRRGLLAAGREQFARFGLKRASIEELARAAGIAKGSFYLFFDSKEALLFESLLEVEVELRQELLRELDRPFASTKEFIVVLLTHQMDTLDRHPLVGVLNDPDAAIALMRAIPAETIHAAKESDEQFLRDVLGRHLRRGSALLKPARRRILAALPRALYALQLQRGLIGTDMRTFRRFLIESAAASLAAGSSLR